MAVPVRSKKVAAPTEKTRVNLISWRLGVVLPAVGTASRDRSVSSNGNEQGEKREANPAAAAKASKPIPIAEVSGAWR
jgi:hypothetical protein